MPSSKSAPLCRTIAPKTTEGSPNLLQDLAAALEDVRLVLCKAQSVTETSECSRLSPPSQLRPGTGVEQSLVLAALAIPCLARTLDEELTSQKARREEDIMQLHSACEMSLEGLPLEFYQELCSQETGDLGNAPLTVSQYGHILQAVGGYVKTLLRENMELQEAQRSFVAPLMQSSDSAVSLTHLALTPLSSGTSDRDSRTDRQNRSTHAPVSRRPHDQRSDTPELSRQVFAVHQELAQSREEVRQMMVQRDLEREVHVRRSSLEMSRAQELSELSGQNQQYLAEVRVLREELRSRHECNDLSAKAVAAAISSGEDEHSEERTGIYGAACNHNSLAPLTSSDFIAPVAERLESSGAEKPSPHTTAACEQTSKPRWRRDLPGRESPGATEASSPGMLQPAAALNARSPGTYFHAKSEGEPDEPQPGLQSRQCQGMEDRYGRDTSSEQADALTSNGAKAAALRRAFYCAEQLCERQHYTQALPLLEEVVHYCEGSPDVLSAAGMKLSDAWAYIGVASQAEGLTEQSVASYRKAIGEDPCLHVCHANLASLCAFRNKHADAQHHMSIALQLDPRNQAYAALALELKHTSQATSG